jgi:lipooligosaccharide transport system permease protein
MPIYLQPLGWISPLWPSVQLGRHLSYGMELADGMFFVHLAYLAIMGVVAMRFVYPKFKERLSR